MKPWMYLLGAYLLLAAAIVAFPSNKWDWIFVIVAGIVVTGTFWTIQRWQRRSLR